MASTSTKLDVAGREAAHSRETRRLRRAGRVPGILYGGGEPPVSFSVQERELRHALAGAGAVLELTVDGGSAQPAVLKESQRHPVRGELMHVDLLRVDLKVAITATVPVHLTGGDAAPGVRDGGVLEQVTRELHIEALPTSIPEAIEVDVSALEINATLTLGDIAAPSGVTLLDDPETTILASVTPPSSEEPSGDEIETETAVVGEAAPAAPAGAAAPEASSDAGDSAE